MLQSLQLMDAAYSYESIAPDIKLSKPFAMFRKHGRMTGSI